MEKIQFNYDLWVNNKDKYDLVTRDGRPAKVYHYDPTNNVDYRIIGCVDCLLYTSDAADEAYDV